MTTDQELWQRARGGDADAFGELYETHARAVQGYCLWRTGSTQVSEDAAATVFLEAWRKRERLRLTTDTAAPLLLGIANNVMRHPLGLEPLPADYAAPGREAARAYIGWSRVLSDLQIIKPGNCRSPQSLARETRKRLAKTPYSHLRVVIESDEPCGEGVESRGRVIVVETRTRHEDEVAGVADQASDALTGLSERASLECIAPERFGALARNALDRAGLDQVRVGVSQKFWPCTYGSGGFSPEKLQVDIGASDFKTWRSTEPPSCATGASCDAETTRKKSPTPVLVTESGAQRSELGTKLRDFTLKASEAILGGSLFLTRVVSCSFRSWPQQLLEALLLLSGAFRVAGDLTALDQALERLVDAGEISEVVKSLTPLLQLARRLRAAQHQHGQQRDLGVIEVKGLVEQMPVLARSAAGAARQAGPTSQGQAAQSLDHFLLVVVDNRLAVGRLVAGEAQGVERKRVDIGRRVLLLDQAAEHTDLYCVGLHR